MSKIKNIARKILGKKISSAIHQARITIETKTKKPSSRFRQWFFLKIFLPNLYRLFSIRKVKQNKIVFIEYQYDYISNSYSLLLNELKKNYSFEIVPVFLEMRSLSGRFKRTVKMCFVISNAKYIFLSDGFLTFHCLPIRKETITTNVFHACGAFKRFGYAILDGKFGASEYEKKHFPMYQNITYAPVSSNNVLVTEPYISAFGVEKKPNVIRGDIGVSRTDIFFDKSKIDNAYEKLYLKYPQVKGKKILLYAPTFRGNNQRNAKIPNALNIEIMFNQLSDEWILLIKHHPLATDRQVINPKHKSFAFDVSLTMNIEDVIMVSDLCVSDYSSLIFEYSLFLRPMIFFPYDLDDYYNNRGFFHDYNTFAPGPICQTNRQMIDRVKTIDSWFDVNVIKDFREKFMSSCDGKATKRLMNLVFGEALAENRRDVPLSDEEIAAIAPVGSINTNQEIIIKDVSLEEEKDDRFTIAYLPNTKTNSFWNPDYTYLSEELSSFCSIVTNHTFKFSMFEEKLIKSSKRSNNDLINIAELVITNNKHLSRELAAKGKPVILLLATDAKAELHNWCPICYDTFSLVSKIRKMLNISKNRITIAYIPNTKAGSFWNPDYKYLTEELMPSCFVVANNIFNFSFVTNHIFKFSRFEEQLIKSSKRSNNDLGNISDLIITNDNDFSRKLTAKGKSVILLLAADAKAEVHNWCPICYDTVSLVKEIKQSLPEIITKDVSLDKEDVFLEEEDMSFEKEDVSFEKEFDDRITIAYLPNTKTNSFWDPDYTYLTGELSSCCSIVTNHTFKFSMYEKQLMKSSKRSNNDLVNIAELVITNNKHLSRELAAKGKPVVLLLAAIEDKELHDWCPICYDSVSLVNEIKKSLEKTITMYENKITIAYIPNIKTNSFWDPDYTYLTGELSSCCSILTNHNFKFSMFEERLMKSSKRSNNDLANIAELVITNNKHLSRELVAKGKPVVLLLAAIEDKDLHDWCPVCYDSVSLVKEIKYKRIRMENCEE